MSSLREVLTVRLRYPENETNDSEFSERLACEPEAPGLVRLTEFSNIIALCPGDLLLVDDQGIATAVEEYAPGILAEAHFHEGTDMDVVHATAELWGRATTVNANVLTVDILSESQQWLDEVVGNNRLVEAVIVRRRPGDAITLSDLWGP